MNSDHIKLDSETKYYSQEIAANCKSYDSAVENQDSSSFCHSIDHPCQTGKSNPRPDFWYLPSNLHVSHVFLQYCSLIFSRESQNPRDFHVPHISLAKELSSQVSRVFFVVSTSSTWSSLLAFFSFLSVSSLISPESSFFPYFTLWLSSFLSLSSWGSFGSGILSETKWRLQMLFYLCICTSINNLFWIHIWIKAFIWLVISTDNDVRDLD